MFSAPAPMELIVILGIALLVLGPKRLPEAARSVGRGVREFRQSLSDASVSFTDDRDEDEEDDDDIADDEDVVADASDGDDEFGDDEPDEESADDATDDAGAGDRPERADTV